MKIPMVFCFIILLSFSALEAQNDIQAGKMHFWSTVENDSILIKINAPTQGWLAVGFNQNNQIIGSDLKMFCVRAGKVIMEDQFVKGIQNHLEDINIGGTNNLKLIYGFENSNGTSIAFKIPLASGDSYDYFHEIGQELWLILAYSVEDDFEHHSIMRKHFQIKWKE